MMQQIEIQYFFPLTEQIPLDLDFTPCEKYIEEWRAEQFKNSVTSGMTLMFGNGGTSWATVSSNLGEPSFTINVDQTPITIVSKKKPNIIKQYIYKALGMKWKSE